jgi:hypothetical protein
MEALPEGLIESILLSESSDSRFEKFCAELYERSENITLLPTSSTYDRGRDAISLSPSRGSHAVVICATLNKDIDDKVRSDLLRISGTTDPDRLIYCSSQRLTEHKKDQLEAEIRKVLKPSCSAAMQGCVQIGKLSARFPEVFQKFYQAEISTLRNTLLAFQHGEESVEKTGLRLALITAGSDDARALRKNISKRAVLDVLRQYGQVTPGKVAVVLSADLRLPKTLDENFIISILSEMVEQKLVEVVGGAYVFTEKGREEAEAIPKSALENFAAGRGLIRLSLQQLTGIAFAEAQFETLWSTLLDVLGEVFYSNGLHIILAVNELIAGEQATAEPKTEALDTLLRAGAKRIGALMSSPEQGREVEQAVIDLFTERKGEAFEWLSHVCERFVGLCSLGLEANSSDEIRKVLTRNRFVLDSDILITLMCEGEPDHKVARDLIGDFRKRGGKVLTSSVILEEVAHHAWISERDFRATEHLLGKLAPHERRRYVDNAFARTFHALARSRADAKKWSVYIQQFRGTSSSDYTRVLRVLKSELAIGILPLSGSDGLTGRIAQYLRDTILASGAADQEFLPKKLLDKTNRDAAVLASIAQARGHIAESGQQGSIVLLSSSRLLDRAYESFRADLGYPKAVISLGAFSYLLSLLPNVSLGAGTLRRALFEFGKSAHMPDTERLALRVIRGVDEFDLPFARRVTLRDRLEENLYSEASKLGMKVSVTRAKFEEADPKIEPASLLVKSLQQMAISDSRASEAAEAQRKIRVLYGKIQDLEEDLASAMEKLNVELNEQ